LSMVCGVRCPTVAACTSSGKCAVRLAGKAPGSVSAGKSGEGSEQRPIVFKRFGHLVVEALVVLKFYSVAAEPDSLGDQYPCAGLAVVVAEQRAGYRIRKAGYAGQRCEPHFRVHLRLSAVTHRVDEVTGELEQQLGVRVRWGFLVFHRQHNFASRAAAGDLTEFGDADDTVGFEHARSPECIGENPCPAAAQRRGVGGEPHAGMGTTAT